MSVENIATTGWEQNPPPAEATTATLNPSVTSEEDPGTTDQEPLSEVLLVREQASETPSETISDQLTEVESEQPFASAHAVERTNRRHRRSGTRKFASTMMTLSLVAGGAIGADIADAPNASADTTGGYPWAIAPCEFAPNGGTSCANPNNPGDMYDWGEYGSNGAFQPYRNGAFEYRNCTDFVAWKLESQGVSSGALANLGNGGMWYTNASASERSLTPVAGDAAVQPESSAHPDGHVAYIDAVNSNGTIQIEEYNYAGTGAWDTRTGTPSALGFSEYVNFGIETSTGSTPPPPSGQGSGVGTAAYVGTDHLVVNQPMYQNQFIESPDGMFVLEMQGNGDLVEYGPGYQPVWASNTAGENIGYVVLQPDGNLVGYTPDGKTSMWGNGEANSGNANSLWMQPDGNLVEYTSGGSAVWSDGEARPASYYPPAYKGGNELQIGEGLYQNQYIRSANGEHFVLLQPDGSSVVYGPAYHVTGGFGPPQSGAGYDVLNSDGNFVEYAPNGQTSLWGNGETNSGGNYMVIQDDGNFVEYQANGQTAVWGTGTAGDI